MKTVPAHLIQTVLLGGALSVAPSASFAQQPTPPRASYRVQFVLTETAGGKSTVRTYNMMLTSDSTNSIRVGGKVPVKTESGKFTYQNTGLDIDCSASKDATANALPLRVTVQLTTAVPTGVPDLPVFRTASSSSNPIVQLGKTVTVSKFQDLDTDATYELKVTAVSADDSSAASIAVEPGEVHPDHQQSQGNAVIHERQ